MNKTNLKIKEIKAGNLYHLKDIAATFGYRNPNSVYKLANTLKAKGYGDNRIVLGENILRYLGSVSAQNIEVKNVQKSSVGVT